MKEDPKTILVVEDDPVCARVLISYVIRRGYNPLHASSGTEAFKILASNKIDLMILDLGLPNMSGYSLLELCLQQNIQVPTVVCSGTIHTTDHEQVEFIHGKKKYPYLEKPPSFETFIALLNRIFGVNSVPAPS